jgi:hypothetical protein
MTETSDPSEKLLVRRALSSNIRVGAHRSPPPKSSGFATSLLVSSYPFPDPLAR